MSEMKDHIRERESADLQNAIRNGLLIPEAAEIAARVLGERGDQVPAPRTEDEIEEYARRALKESTRKFLFVATGVATWLAYATWTEIFSDVPRMNMSLFAMGVYLWLALRDWKRTPPRPSESATVKNWRKSRFADAVFLSPPLTRLTWCVSIAIAVRIVSLGISLNTAQPEWLVETAGYQKWIASGKARDCEKLFADTRLELDSLPTCSPVERMRTFDSSGTYIPTDCDSGNALKIRHITTMITDSGCPLSSDYPPKQLWMLEEEKGTSPRWTQLKLPHYHPPTDPLDLWTFSNQHRPDQIVGEVLILAALLFGITILGGSFLRVEHKGWQRLTLVVTTLSGLLASAYAYKSESNWRIDEVFNHASAAALGAFVSMIYGRRLFLWVRDGFREETPQGAERLSGGPNGFAAIPASSEVNSEPDGRRQNRNDQ